MLYGDISARLSGTPSGGGVQLIDDHDDQNLDEYTDYEANGGITPFDFTSDAFEGDYALRLAGDTSFAQHLSTEGLPYYPSRGDEIVFYTYHSTTTEINHGGYYYGAEDLANLYFTRIDVGNSEISLWEKYNDTNSVLVNITATPDPGWLKWRVQWGDGDTFGHGLDVHHLRVERVDDGSLVAEGSGEAVDHYTENGGVGQWGAAASGEELRWDYAHVTNADAAEPGTVIENWEDGSPFSEWEDNVSGSLGEWGVATGAPEGDYWAQNEVNDFSQINSENGQLDYYPKQGDRIEWYVYTGDLYAVLTWAFPDDRNSYWGRPRVAEDELEMELAGTRYEAAVSAGVDPDTWYKMRLDWDDGDTFGGSAGDHTLTLMDLDDNELAQVTGNDTENVDPQGIAVSAEANGGIDDIRKVPYDPGPEVVADFETDLSAWTATTGSLSDFELDAAAAQHGDLGVQPTVNSYVQIDSQPGDGLGYYPSQGDAIEWYVYSGDTYSVFVWGAQAAGEIPYYARPRPDNGVLELIQTGTTYTANYSFQAKTWYKMRLEWDDGSTFGGAAGDMTVIAYDMNDNELVRMTENDNTYASGGVGVSFGDIDCKLDYIRKTNT